MTEPSADAIPELLTVNEAAEYLRMPRPTIYYLAKRGQIPAVRIGGRWRIRRSVLDREVLRKDSDSSLPTVLVVDDDVAIQGLFNQFLRKANMGRHVVGTGEQALAAVKVRKVDVVFLDLNLPDMPGAQVYAQLRMFRPDLPIVIITGYPDSGLWSQIFARGPVTVLQKPLEFEHLNRTLKQLGYPGARLAAPGESEANAATVAGAGADAGSAWETRDPWRSQRAYRQDAIVTSAISVQ